MGIFLFVCFALALIHPRQREGNEFKEKMVLRTSSMSGDFWD